MVKIVDKNGKNIELEAYQKLRNLRGPQIGKHFTLFEPTFQSNMHSLGVVVVNYKLMEVLDLARDLYGAPVRISSFNRSEEQQRNLRKNPKLKAAVYSPHVVKMAADVSFYDGKDLKNSQKKVVKFAQCLKTASDKLEYKTRIIFQSYLDNGQAFVHTDVCPEYYAPGKPFHNQNHPKAWERSMFK